MATTMTPYERELMAMAAQPLPPDMVEQIRVDAVAARRAMAEPVIDGYIKLVAQPDGEQGRDSWVRDNTPVSASIDEILAVARRPREAAVGQGLDPRLAFTRSQDQALGEIRRKTVQQIDALSFHYADVVTLKVHLDRAARNGLVGLGWTVGADGATTMTHQGRPLAAALANGDVAARQAVSDVLVAAHLSESRTMHGWLANNPDRAARHSPSLEKVAERMVVTVRDLHDKGLVPDHMRATVDRAAPAIEAASRSRGGYGF